MTISSGSKSNRLSLGVNRVGADFRFGYGGTISNRLYEGENTITIFVEDWAGLTDQQSIKVSYAPIKLESKLLIITPKEFRPALVPLAEYKTRTGIPASIISLESIYCDCRFITPSDLHARIRSAIAYAGDYYDTEYVMLVGDSDKFPVCYCLVRNEGVWEDFFIPSDLYYADIYRAGKKEGYYPYYYSWDGDGDGYYGEMDGIWNAGNYHELWYYEDYKYIRYIAGIETIALDWADSARRFRIISNPLNISIKGNLRPDVAVGRIPASTIGEVATYVKKVIDYENGASADWFRKVLLLTGRHRFSEEKTFTEETNDAIADYILSRNFPGIQKYYYSQHSGSESERAAQINSYLNQGVGFVNYIGHGSTATFDGIYNKDHINGLQNADRLPIFFALSVYSAQFHFWQKFGYHSRYCMPTEGKYQDIYGNFPPSGTGYWAISNPEPSSIQPPYCDMDSWAEELLVKHSTGAIGFTGCSLGIDHALEITGKFDPLQYEATMEAASDLARVFFASFEVLRDECYPEPVTLGMMWNKAIGSYLAWDCFCSEKYWGNPYEVIWTPYENFSNIHKFLLLGDPSLRVGGSPVKYSIDYNPGYYLNLPFSYLFSSQITRDPQIEIFGKMNSPGTLELFEGKNLLLTKEVDEVGYFTISPSYWLNEKVHLFSLRFIDKSGNEVQRETIPVEIDITPPIIKELIYPQSATLKEFYINGTTDIYSEIRLYDEDHLLASTKLTGDTESLQEDPGEYWRPLPPYNLLWPLWSPVLSPVDSLIGLTTPLLSQLTNTSILPVQPILAWNPAQSYPWLLYNTPVSFGGGLTSFDPFYGLNPFPPYYHLHPL